MKVRLLRGQVVVRMLEETTSSFLYTPEPDKRSVKTHRARVLQVGPPAMNCAVDKMGRCESITCKHVEVPYGFESGDTVQFHFEDHQEKRTREWTDGRPSLWLMQREIDGVIEP